MVKHNKVFRILAVAVIFALLLVAIPATPALAQTITLSPTSGPVNTTVTLTGTGYSAYYGHNVYILFNYTYTGTMISVPSSGTFSTTFTVPSTATTGTTAYVTVQYDTYTYDASYQIGVAYFTVTTRSITLSSYSGYVGDTVTVSGTGFTASSSVTIYFDSTTVTTTTASTAGVVSCSFTVPDSYKGSHTVKAYDTSSANYATTTFTVSPKVTITPTTGAVGDTVTVSGAGFAASKSITVYFNVTSMSTTSTDTYGTFSAVTFTIPSTSRGSYSIKAQDSSANYATATFTLAQKITINPASGYSGISVSVTGSGFNTSSSITITYNAVAVTTTPAAVTTDATGSFSSATFTVPGGLAGTYTVEATDGTNTATASFTSTTDATISQTTSATAPGSVGDKLTITGAGFKPNTTVTITYTSESVTLATVTSDGTGSFTATITIPASEAGAHTIKVSDNQTTKEFTFYMESTPPETPQPQLPYMGDKLKENFDWDDVEDDSEPVTYDLQVASDPDFTFKLLNKTGLTTSEYTLTKEEKLESTSKEEPYYWRVRAVDAASNEGAWSGAGEFYVGFSFGIPELEGWVLYALMGAGAILVFFIGFWLGRRGGGGEYY